jgi:hypothetical protein
MPRQDSPAATGEGTVVATPLRPTPVLAPDGEAFLAALTRAAYDVALRHGVTGPFTDLELDLWHELREVVRSCEADAPTLAAAGGAA